MDQYVTGATIKELREEKKLTQLELAERLHVSDKTISKWETGKGYPELSLLEALAAELGVSLAELLSGTVVKNTNISGNMLRSHFYVCPVCGNILHSMGAAQIACHGILLPALEAEPEDEPHAICVERVEDEYFVTVTHEMTREHHISFLAAVSTDRLQLVKLYPEGPAQARFKIQSVKNLYGYCNRDGLFQKKIR